MAPKLRFTMGTLLVALAVLALGSGAAWLAFRPPESPLPAGFAVPSPSAEPSLAATGKPDELRILCGPGKLRLSARRVRAAPDGVHLRIEAPEGTEWSLGMDLRRQAWPSQHWGTGPDPKNPRILPLPPGPVYAWCTRVHPAADPPDSEGRRVFTKFRVVDPEGLWIPTEPECRRPRGVARDSVAGRGVGTWEEAVREGLAGVRPSDTVARAGYPVATPETKRIFPVVVIRDGRSVVRANIVYHGPDDGYFFFGAAVCPGTGIGAV